MKMVAKVLSGLLLFSSMNISPVGAIAGQNLPYEDVIVRATAKVVSTTLDQIAERMANGEEALVKGAGKVVTTVGNEAAQAVVKVLRDGSGELGENFGSLASKGSEAIVKLSTGSAEAIENLNGASQKAIVDTGLSLAQAIKPVQTRLLLGACASAAISVAGIAAYHYVKKYIAKYAFEPSLIEKRSSSGVRQKLGSLLWSKQPVRLEDHMVISKQLAEELNYMMSMTKNTIKNGGQFEHALLYGLPGTGKTLFAQLLAEYCGMAYAFVPAANVSQFLANGTAVQELRSCIHEICPTY